MAHPVIHAEIRSADPDATRAFFADLFGWKVASEGAFPGYTFIDTGVEGSPYVAISPRQSSEDEVLFFVGGRGCRRHPRQGGEARRHHHSTRAAGAGHQLRCFRRRAGSPRRRRSRLTLTG